jgi:CheY-like chemotaxis protein
MIAGVPTIQGSRILVVEDDYLVAQVLVDLLEDAGAEVIGPVGWIDEAIALIEDDNQKLDGAVLDVNLHGKKSYPVADALAARSVGFVFATGYDAGIIESKYRDYPRCEKPFRQTALVAALAISRH